MREGYIVVREDDHIDAKFWVCEKLEDAEKIFLDVATYWKDKFSEYELDLRIYGENILQIGTIDGDFNIYVSKQQIREKGEFRQKSTEE